MAASSIPLSVAILGLAIPAVATIAAAGVTAIMSRRATRETNWSKQRELDQTAFTAITDAQGKQIDLLSKRADALETKNTELDAKVEYQQHLIDKAVGYIVRLRGIITGQGLTAPEPPRELRLRDLRDWRNKR